MKRKALGKGLRSLIPETPRRKSEPITDGNQTRTKVDGLLKQIDIDLISPNRKQPRQSFDEAALFELANSLKSKGFIQPIVVRPAEDDRFELVAGERRWRAAQQAGLLRIPAIIREIPDEQLLETALIENIQREELNAMDEAGAYRTLVEELGLSQQDVAQRVGKQRATVANMLRLLSLEKPVQEMVRSGSLSMGHARALVAVGEPTRQINLAMRVAREGLSVRQVESLATKQVQALGTQRTRPAMRRDPNVVAAEEALQRVLGTRVRIFEGKKGGRLELYFHNKEELSRVYDLIFGAAGGRANEA